jgi:hypothetical protein
VGELEELLFAEKKGGRPHRAPGDRVCFTERHIIPEGKTYCQPCATIRKNGGKDLELCRKQKHPVSMMKTKKNGNRYCAGCRDDWKQNTKKKPTTYAERVRLDRLQFTRRAYSSVENFGDPEGHMREIELECGCRKLFGYNHVPISVLELVWCQFHRDCYHPVPLSQWRVGEGEIVVGD